MAFTGDLEHLHIVDIIQLLHTTRKSGTFSVKGRKGESRIIFSNGYIVGASHLDGKIRIGTVLVRMNAISRDDLDAALAVQKNAGKSRKPLITTLIELGRLSHEEASRGLKKLIEITVVELIGWTKGTFTLDMDAIEASPECSYLPDRMEQEVSLDGQMILMDALRIFDERERDRQAGRDVPAFEELFPEAISPQRVADTPGKTPALTAEDLGLGDIEHLQRKIPQFSPVDELFNPLEMHRQKIRETLSDFSAEEQEAMVSFFEQASAGAVPHDRQSEQDSRARAFILFSEDEFIKHSLMTICKGEGILSFAAEGEEELDNIVSQCLTVRALPLIVFDGTEMPGGMLSKEKISGLCRQIKAKHSSVSVVQIASSPDYSETLQAYRDGVRAVFTRPSVQTRRSTFIEDAILFLRTLTSYIKGFFDEQLGTGADQPCRLKQRMLALRNIQTPPEISFALLQAVAEFFERTVSFIVRPEELVGERAIGVYSEKDKGSSPASPLRIPLSGKSVFRNVIDTETFFYGETDDAAVREHLHAYIDAPLKPTVLLLPMKVRGKIMTLVYGDFGMKETSPIDVDELAIFANLAGLSVENILYRKLLNKQAQQRA